MKVLFLPINNVPVEVCSHRLGAIATISHCTDQLRSPSRYAAELIGFEHNIAVTSFVGTIHGESDDMANMLITGRWGFGVYFPTAFWYRAGQAEVIPDYEATVWTATGKAFFPGVTIGAPKTVRFPNHGQELFDISGGVYGFDEATQTPGTNNLREITDLAQYSLDIFKNQTSGKNASVMSYQNGALSCSQFIMPYYLAGRNSNYTRVSDGVDGRTAYGKDQSGAYLGLPQIPVTFQDRISQAITTRYWDTWKPSGEAGKPAAKAFEVSQLQKTMLNGGWFTDFIHYHQAFSDGTFNSVDDLFDLLNDTIGSSFVWRTGFDDAMEYMFLRTSIIKTVGHDDGSKVSVFMQVDEFLIDKYEKIQVPVSIEIDLSGTSLAGKDVMSHNGKVYKSGMDTYVVDTRLRNLRDGIYSFVIEETLTPEYIDLNMPIGSFLISGTDLVVTTDINTRAVLFQQTGATKYDCKIIERSNDLKTEHIFNVSGLSGQLSVGIISEYKQSNLILI